MNLERMLQKCEAGQWQVSDLDWSLPPKELRREDEIAVVQYFTDMAGIERLAKALFEEQRRRETNSTLQKIFDSFVIDEERHALVAERLAKHYDRHHYHDYRTNPSLLRFQPHFLRAIKSFTPEVANAYILAGELILDVALLRSIDDHVDDEMSHRAMHLINRDESRHIAIDYHMAEYYSSDEYQERLDSAPGKSVREVGRDALGLARMLYYAGPFFRDVFLSPMSVVDPDGVRLREAFKRIHILAHKPGVRQRPFARFMLLVQEAYNQPMLKRILGPLLIRIIGVPGEMIETLYTSEELERAGRMSFDELAQEAIEAKNYF